MKQITFPIVISAPSGAGKTTVAQRLLQEMPKTMKMSVSYTTRAPRPGEQQGKDYHFISTERFYEMIEQNELIEWAEVHGFLYGINKITTAAVLGTGSNIIFILDVQGARKFRTVYPDCLQIFLVPRSMEQLEERLRGRGTDDEQTILKRLAAARSEMADGVADYPYLIENTDLDQVVEEIKTIIWVHGQCLETKQRTKKVLGI